MKITGFFKFISEVFSKLLDQAIVSV